MQQSLDLSPHCQSIPLTDGALLYYPNWLSETIADIYFSRLKSGCAWQQSTIQIAGKPIKIPRLNAWYGEKGASYSYSGKSFTPLPWNRPLRSLLGHLNRTIHSQSNSFLPNSALVNCYRDGADSVAWHADDETELGKAPTIASVSLGAERRFVLKHRVSRIKRELTLEHGSLLIMLPPLQSHWVHAIPKTKAEVGTRINVTFRQVFIGASNSR